MWREARLVVRVGVLALALAQVGAAAPARQPESLVLAYEGSRLSIKQTAPVPYSDLTSLLAALPQAASPGRYALVLFRDSPRQVVGYLLAVERAGTLSLGSQLHQWDPGDRRYRLLRGELYRSYQRLEEPGPWTWTVTVPVSREYEASLVVRARETRWPVRSVSVSVTGQPAR